MEHLRPLERRMLHMRDQGLRVDEIARRVRHSPEHTGRIFEWMTIPRQQSPTRRIPRPIENRLLALRAAGETHEQVATRFKRSPKFVRQVEGLAHYRLGLELLGTSRAGDGE